ncbi:putative fad binding protein [Phaeoacremonium minimum UCRPA7]|uniref:Putative fad binding protein n=1 Tax=Phaeoacremonium minimum (strain UCR-PA7) TaxID=1286976 RepID=R8BXF9_PHAM7|nr:putative fad binding protein [Phaeoacremonium minimum UCRPA7]EOO03959.1 putative fad binding protein [Phaeoacremonium minimum UCRPA7]
MTKTVVVLGGSYAGLHIAHYLLKNASDIKVVLVSKNSHFFWNLATVRAIVPGQIKDETIFQSLEKALQRYPDESYELIVGSAEKVDFGAKTVLVSAAAGGERTLSYDHLVLATGSRNPSPDVPWKAAGSYEEAVKTLHATADKVKAAKHIVVAGAGATGVEVAGELGYEYGKGDKEVILLSAEKEIMGGDIVAPAARNELTKLGVKIRGEAKVTGTKKLENGKTEISLANGETITTDLYLPTMGLVPNSEYIDAKYLNEKKNVVVDEFFNVKNTKDVWAAGDIVGSPRCGFMITQKHAAGVGKNIVAALSGKPPVVVKGPPIDILACAVGRGRGAGRMGSFKMFSIMIWLAKGRTLATQMVPGYIDGSVA